MMEKEKFIQKILEKEFSNPKSPLKFTNAFTFLVAIVLSAQARDDRVNDVTKFLFKIAKTPEKMLELSQKKLENIIKSVGLAPTKSKNILKFSKILIEKFDSKVPNTFEELESLPGVGHKTASVIISHYFNKPAFAVDTHVFRCAKRWGLTSKNSTIKKTEQDLKDKFPKNKWSKLHWQIIYFGRKFCPAKGHIIKNCPICSKLKK